MGSREEAAIPGDMLREESQLPGGGGGSSSSFSSRYRRLSSEIRFFLIGLRVGPLEDEIDDGATPILSRGVRPILKRISLTFFK